MSKDPAFLFYPGDFLGGTMGWSIEEKGAYLEMLMLQFNTGHFTSEMVSRMLGLNHMILWSVIGIKFKQDKDGLFYNIRLDEEKGKRTAFCESRRKNKSYDTTYDTTYDKHMTRHMEDEDEDENRIEIKAPLTKEIKTIPEQSKSLSQAEVMKPLSAPLEALYGLWKQHLSEKQAPLTQTACGQLRDRFRAWGEVKTKELVEKAISSNWKSIVEDRYNTVTKNETESRPTSRNARDIMADLVTSEENTPEERARVISESKRIFDRVTQKTRME
jgi:uncharacterized protein YdaU (DUF1376 family)